MRYFREVEVATYCSLSEAAEWIVRQKVPEARYTEEGLETRGSLIALLPYNAIIPEPLVQEELRYFGSNLTYEEYLDALSGPGFCQSETEEWKREAEQIDYTEADSVHALIARQRRREELAQTEHEAVIEAD